MDRHYFLPIYWRGAVGRIKIRRYILSTTPINIPKRAPWDQLTINLILPRKVYSAKFPRVQQVAHPTGVKPTGPLRGRFTDFCIMYYDIRAEWGGSQGKFRRTDDGGRTTEGGGRRGKKVIGGAGYQGKYRIPRAQVMNTEHRISNYESDSCLRRNDKGELEPVASDLQDSPNVSDEGKMPSGCAGGTPATRYYERRMESDVLDWGRGNLGRRIGRGTFLRCCRMPLRLLSLFRSSRCGLACVWCKFERSTFQWPF